MDERKVGLQIGSGNLALASFRVIGQFASAEVIRLSDGGGSHPQMPAVIHFSQESSQSEVGRGAKIKWIKMADHVYSPLRLLAEGRQTVTVGHDEIPVEKLLTKMVSELREAAGLFGDFNRCSVAYPDYLSSEQLVALKNAVRAEIPELDDRHFVPASFSVLFDMQLHQARYNLGYHKFDFSSPKTVLVVDLGENFTSASVLEVKEVGQELEARYLAKPFSSKVGGRDFDLKFSEYLIDLAALNGSLSESDLTPEFRRQLQTDAEKFKRDLVEKTDAQIISTHVPSGKLNDLSVPLRIYGNSGKKILEKEITKRDYDTSVFPCIASIHEDEPCIFQTVGAALNLAGLRPGNVDEVILIGGMARVHVIGEVLKHTFGKIPREFANPELSSVRGASIYHDMVSSPLEMRI